MILTAFNVCVLLASPVLSLLAPSGALRPRGAFRTSASSSALQSSSADDAARTERMRQIMAEEAANPSSLADSAEAMKNMKPEDMDKLLSEFDAMPAAQKEQLKSMGMDPNLMKKSMEMMKQNPAIMKSAQKMMETMTPEEIASRSRMVQEQMSKMAPEQVEATAAAMTNLSPDQIAAAAEVMQNNPLAATAAMSQMSQKEEEAPEEAAPSPAAAVAFAGSAEDPDVLDAMYRCAEFMSSPPTGQVTFRAFATLPPVVALGGTSDEDLNPRELRECWEDASLGSTRVDRVGFERVWLQVREFFEDDIMEEARKTITLRKTSSLAAAAPAPPAMKVGAELNTEQLNTVNEQVKNMSDAETVRMFEEMSDMSPEQEARITAMGVDSAMLKKTTKMMKDNPMMRKAAQAMMKNMSPEQMLKMSQQAQEQMGKMSPEEYDRTMEQFKDK